MTVWAPYLDGVIVALGISGVVAAVGALLAWAITGRRDPLETVNEPNTGLVQPPVLALQDRCKPRR